jgi:hypothetical protein
MKKIKSAWTWWTDRVGPFSWADFLSALAGGFIAAVIGVLFVAVVMK